MPAITAVLGPTPYRGCIAEYSHTVKIPHAFRHSAASLIHDRTGSLKLAQDLLGHANLDTTADTYTHPSTEAQREAYEVLEQAFFRDLFPMVPKTGNTNSKLVN